MTFSYYYGRFIASKNVYFVKLYTNYKFVKLENTNFLRFFPENILPTKHFRKKETKRFAANVLDTTS